MAVLSWDPAQAANSGTTYTSGTMQLLKLLYPFDRVSTLLRYFSAAFTGQTSLGWVLYSTDGVGPADITTLTKIATIDITSTNNGIGDVRHTFTTVTGLTPGNAIYVGFLQVGATAGSTRQNSGATLAAAPNAGLSSGAGLNWATAASTTGLANLAAAPSTITASTLASSALTGPPCYGLRP
jgi:hypothetical protein